MAIALLTDIIKDEKEDKISFYFMNSGGLSSLVAMKLSTLEGTWPYLSEGMYVSGLMLDMKTGMLDPKSDIRVVPEGKEMEYAEETATIGLKEPWWGAGTSLKWKIADRVGFGINAAIYRANDNFIIKTQWGNYGVKKSEVEEFAKNNNTSDTRKGTLLVIIPRGICKQIK